MADDMHAIARTLFQPNGEAREATSAFATRMRRLSDGDLDPTQYALSILEVHDYLMEIDIRKNEEHSDTVLRAFRFGLTLGKSLELHAGAFNDVIEQHA